MRRSTMVLGVLALFLASLAAAAVAEARVGGGRSSGSRGSRSFSAPLSPSSPASPTAPQRAYPAPAPQRPGGFLGGLGSMLGGLFLGGLLGSLLFGGLGHGLGFLDIIALAGLAYLVYSFLRRRQPQPAMAGGPAARMGWTPTAGGLAGGPGAPVSHEVADLHRGIRAIRMTDPAFDPGRFAGTVARELFVRVQTAWTTRELAMVRGQLTEEMATGLEGDLARLRERGHLNRIESVSVDSAETTEAWQESGQDYVTVRIRARGLDYTLDERTGGVIEGSRTSPAAFEEFWTFARPVGPNPWRLSAIQQPVS